MQTAVLIPKYLIFLIFFSISFHASAHRCGLNKGQTADMHIEMLAIPIGLHKSEHGRYLTQKEGLAGLLVFAEDGSQKINKDESYIRRLPLDPWGNSYQYRYPGIKKP